MHSGRKYQIKEFLIWTRRDLFLLVIIASTPTLLYVLAGWKWLSIPWLPIALVGTAVAFVIGFKNNASYERAWEGRRAWGAIVNASRSWGIMTTGFVTNRHAKEPISSEEIREIHTTLIYRHFAWLAALRYQLREPRAWENMSLPHNAEYRKKVYAVEELDTPLSNHLSTFLSPGEIEYVSTRKNKATQIISLQSTQLKVLLAKGLIEDFRHMELEKLLVEFYAQQGVCERLKNFPYPRQFASLNSMFIWLFVLMVPFGMLQEFDKMGEYFAWLTIPFSVLVSWIFTSLERVGEVTENPFEGGANDIPITALSRTIEIDLREMLNEKDIPPAKQPVNNILL